MFKYPLFSVLGIEIEYMLVDKDTLNVKPVSDLIFKELSGEFKNEIDFDNGISISNELVKHVVELKNTNPLPLSTEFTTKFYDAIHKLQPILQQYNLTLLPTAAHPWMNPKTETKIWDHSYHEIYEKYDAIFNCNNHGWSNLQSIHINLPFSNMQEFAKLHNAIRLILPILPALAASSPFLENKTTGFLDSRLNIYGNNQVKISTIAGEIIPEFIINKKQYELDILIPMYKEINQFDSEKILQNEWLNSRGAIAKFEQGAIEIRILDTQECVKADFAIIYIIIELLKDLTQNSNHYLSDVIPIKPLKDIYNDTIKYGFAAIIDNPQWLAQLNLPTNKTSAGAIWEILFDKFKNKLNNDSVTCLENILNFGNLSERMLKEYKKNTNLKNIYLELGNCLLKNSQYNI